MTSKTFARIEDGIVAEVFTTERDIRALFCPALLWVAVEDDVGVAHGWLYDGSRFTAPPQPVPPAAPSLSDLQARLSALNAEIASLTQTKP